MGFLPIFLPWSIDPTYRTKTPDDLSLTEEEKKLAELYGLDAEQIYWRRRKIGELRSEDLFKREYPLTPDEAFMASSFDSYITNDLVMKAHKEEIEPYGPLIVDVDPAGKGADSTAIAWRRGHCIVKTERHRGLDTMEVAGWVAQIIREDKPAKVNIDVGGLGIGVYDRLIEQGHDSGVVTAVNFGGNLTAINDAEPRHFRLSETDTDLQPFAIFDIQQRVAKLKSVNICRLDYFNRDGDALMVLKPSAFMSEGRPFDQRLQILNPLGH